MTEILTAVAIGFLLIAVAIQIPVRYLVAGVMALILLSVVISIPPKSREKIEEVGDKGE